MAIEVKYYNDDEKEALENNNFNKHKNKKGRKTKNRMKRGGRRRIVTVLIFTLLAAGLIVLAVLWLSGSDILKLPNKVQQTGGADVKETNEETDLESETENKAESETESETASVTGVNDTIPGDEWYMLLVNMDHPLPEDFTVDLAVVDDRGNEVDERIADDLEQMLEEGNSTGLQLVISSAYRSVELQKTLWDKRVNQFIAEGMTQEEAEEKTLESVMYPDCSDHNTGLGVDIVSVTNQKMEDDFAETAEAEWLAANAWKYGFILRFPQLKESITGVKYEPWHYRYVGKEQAKIIYERGVCLEEYLEQ